MLLLMVVVAEVGVGAVVVTAAVVVVIMVVSLEIGAIGHQKRQAFRITEKRVNVGDHCAGSYGEST